MCPQCWRGGDSSKSPMNNLNNVSCQYKRMTLHVFHLFLSKQLSRSCRSTTLYMQGMNQFKNTPRSKDMKVLNRHYLPKRLPEPQICPAGFAAGAPSAG